MSTTQLEMMTHRPMVTVDPVNYQLRLEKPSLGIRAVNVDILVQELKGAVAGSWSSSGSSGAARSGGGGSGDRMDTT